MKKVILSIYIVLFCGFYQKASATNQYTAATTVKQLWIQDYQGVRFVYFSLDNTTFFGFPLNHECAEHWLSQLEMAMQTNHKAIQVGYDDAASLIDAKTKSGIRPFFHLGVLLDGGP